MECYSFSTYRNIFFDDLEEIIPSFSSKNVGERFSFIMECKDYDIACVCITNICIMHGARDTLVKDISGSSVVRHLPLVLEVPGSIPARGEKNFGVRTRFLWCHLQG